MSDLTANTSVPNWMVRLGVWLIGVLGSGAVLTLVSVVNWCFWMQRDQGELKAANAAREVKEADMVNALNALGGKVQTGFDSLKEDLHAVQSDVAILKTRMGGT